MPLHRSIRLALLAIALATTAVTLAQTNAVVEVTVVDSDSEQAIPRAKIILYDGSQAVPDTEVNAFVNREMLPVLSPGGRIVPAPLPPPRGQRSVETNDLGKAIFADVKTGSYRLDAEGDGYLSQRQQHLSGIVAGGILVNVSSGDKANVQVRLKRAGTIAGTVKNSSGEPMADFPVYLLRTTFARSGERRLYAATGTTTDQMGRFTLGGVAQGRYYVAAGRALRTSFSGATSESYQFSYYPGVSDAAVASYIDVGPGTRFDGVDLMVSKEKLYRVRGRIDFGTSKPPDPALSLYGLARPFDMPGTDRRQQLRPLQISPDGRFEINGLPAGTYSISVQFDRRAQRPIGPGESADALFPFEVKNADIDDLELRALDAMSIRGRVRMADDSPLSSIGTAFGRFQVGLDPTIQIQPAGFSVINMNDGSFEIKGVFGTYSVGMPITRGAYISEIRVNGERVRPPMVKLPSGVAGEMEIIVSMNGGSLAGGLVDERSQTVASAKSGLVLEDPLQFPAGFRAQFNTKSDGSFSVESVPPGSYRVYVFDGVDESSIFDPNLLVQSRALATSVHVSERAQTSANVRVIRPR